MVFTEKEKRREEEEKEGGGEGKNARSCVFMTGTMDNAHGPLYIISYTQLEY